jgi:hypothetical protein
MKCNIKNTAAVWLFYIYVTIKKKLHLKKRYYYKKGGLNQKIKKNEFCTQPNTIAAKGLMGQIEEIDQWHKNEGFQPEQDTNI